MGKSKGKKKRNKRRNSKREKNEKTVVKEKESVPKNTKSEKGKKQEKKEIIAKQERRIWPWVVGIGLISAVLVAILFARKRQEFDQYFEKVDILLKRHAPKIDQMRKEIKEFQENIMHQTLDPLLKRIEGIVDSSVDVVKEKFVEFKSKITRYIPEETWLKTVKVSRFAHLNLKNKHPIFIIPGTITTELEVWKGKSCIKQFRSKVWGEISMFVNFFKNKTCWLEHLQLDENTGLDPEGIKVRPRKESIDYFVPGFWVWAVIIKELGGIGYDPNNMHMNEYDWRLGFRDLEYRDKYFTRLKNSIELQYEIHGEKIVILSHSLGGVLWFHFMSWVENIGGANAKYWINKYIHASVNIGAPFLGVPKAVSALLSGEMKDTADLFFIEGLIEAILSREERTKIFRSWRSNLEMLPKGSDEVWGDLVNFRVSEETVNGTKIDERIIRVSNLIPFLQEMSSDSFSEALEDIHLTELDVTKEVPVSHKYFSNPYASPLPIAPFKKLYCFYGIGLETELNYYYAGSDSSLIKTQLDFKSDDRIMKGPIIIDPFGDGTVPYLSLNHACSKLWRQREYNPSNMEIIIKEYEHNPVENILDRKYDFRGGGESGNHVDIMGNMNMIGDILKIAAGQTDVEENIIVTEEYKKQYFENLED